MWSCIRLSLAFGLLFLLQLNMKGQAQASGHSKEACCCEKKTVGAYSYTLNTTGGALPNCLNDCVYTRDNDDDKNKYCFARGIEPVTCRKPACFEISNYCQESQGAYGSITFHSSYPPVNYTVGPAISHEYVKVPDVRNIDIVTATCSYGSPIGLDLECTPFISDPSTGEPSKFNIAGDVDKCIVHAAKK